MHCVAVSIACDIVCEAGVEGYKCCLIGIFDKFLFLGIENFVSSSVTSVVGFKNLLGTLKSSQQFTCRCFCVTTYASVIAVPVDGHSLHIGNKRAKKRFLHRSHIYLGLYGIAFSIHGNNVCLACCKLIHSLLVECKIGFIAERHKLTCLVEDKETYTTLATAHCNRAVGINCCGVAGECCNIAIDKVVYRTKLGCWIVIPQSTACRTVVFFGSLACCVVNEQHCIVRGVILILNFGNCSINLCLCYVVCSIGVVTHYAVFHNFKETVGAEELGEVFAGCITGVFVEAEQRGIATYLPAVYNRLTTAKLEQTRPELCIVTGQVVVEPQAVVQVSYSPDVVGVKVVAIGVKRIKHALQRALAAINARSSHTHIPNCHVREEVVGNLGLSVEVEDKLVLVTYLVSRSPGGAGFACNLANDALHCVIVVVTYTPTTAHITAVGTHTAGVVVEVLAIIDTLTEFLIGLAIEAACVIVVVDFGRRAFACPAGIEGVHSVHSRLAHNTQSGKFGVCDTVPSLEHNVYFTVAGRKPHTGIVGVAVVSKTCSATSIAVGGCGNGYIVEVMQQALLHSTIGIFLLTKREKQCLAMT